MAGGFIYNTQGIKINNISGNASINPGETNVSGNSITQKNIGISFSIGDFSPVFSQQNSVYSDPDWKDQDSSLTPSNASQV